MTKILKIKKKELLAVLIDDEFYKACGLMPEKPKGVDVGYLSNKEKVDVYFPKFDCFLQFNRFWWQFVGKVGGHYGTFSKGQYIVKNEDGYECLTSTQFTNLYEIVEDEK